MKKYLVLSVVVLIGLFAVVAVPGASAAPAEAAAKGPYEGVFHGNIYGENGSSAPMSLDLTHTGRNVDGTVFIGDGLTIDAGVCGAVDVPATAVNASGRSSANNPRALSASSSFDVSGIDVTVDLDSYVAGDHIEAEVTIDLPWICGGDPTLTGQLHRA